MKIHPLCERWPDITGARWESFKQSIANRGLDEPIWRWGNRIIDGKNRLRACEELGIKPTFRDWRPSAEATDGVRQEAELAAFIFAKNFERRHLTDGQLAMFAADMATAEHGGDRSKSSIENLTQDEAAEIAGVSVASVKRASEVQKHGDEELVEAVKAGEVSVSDAASVAKLPKTRQKRALGKVRSGKAKTLKAGAAREPGEDAIEPDHDEAIKDPHGGPVSKRMRKVFAHCKTFRGLVNKIGRLQSEIEELQRSDAGGLIPIQTIQKQLDDLQRAVKFAMPYTECPKCRRKPQDECKSCKGSGWVNEPTFTRSHTKEDEEWLSSRE